LEQENLAWQTPNRLGKFLDSPCATKFNQAQIAAASHPVHGQIYSYGYTILDPNISAPSRFPTAPQMARLKATTSATTGAATSIFAFLLSAPTGWRTPSETPAFTTFYNCPVGLGTVNKPLDPSPDPNGPAPGFLG
jgi:hypothetical protein